MIGTDILSFFNHHTFIFIIKSFLLVIKAIIFLKFFSKWLRARDHPFNFIFIFNLTNIIILKQLSKSLLLIGAGIVYNMPVGLKDDIVDRA